MEAIIKISQSEGGKQVVSARDLHTFLEVGANVNDWMKRQAERAMLIEDEDFVCIPILGSEGRGGQNKVDYAITISAAKEIAMLNGGEKGKQARLYFIECEKKAQSLAPRTLKEALILALEQQERIEQQQQTIKEQAPKALFADAVATSTQSCLVGELSKVLRQNGIEIGQNRLFDYLRKSGYLCQGGERYNQPTQRAMEMELFDIKKTTINKPDGTILITTTTKVTGKGQIYFVNKFLAQKTFN